MSDPKEQTPPTQTHQLEINVSGDPPKNGQGGSYVPDMPATPEGWTTASPASTWQAHHKTRVRAAALTGEVEGLRTQLGEMQTQVAEVDALRAQIDTMKARHEQDLTFAQLGGDFVHPSVQRLVRGGYSAYVADCQLEGAEVQSFHDYMTAEERKADPAYRGYFHAPPPPAELADLPPVSHVPQGRQPVQRPAAPQVDWGSRSVVARYKAAGRLRRGKLDAENMCGVGGSPDWRAMTKWEFDNGKRAGTVKA